MATPSDSLYTELEQALDSAESEDTKYHLRQALQIRIAEELADEEPLSV